VIDVCGVFQSLDCISDRQVLVNGNVRSQLAAAESADCLLDEVLYNLENGVEIALHRAQLWSKFVKDLVSFIDRRTSICEFSCNPFFHFVSATAGQDEVLFKLRLYRTFYLYSNQTE